MPNASVKRDKLPLSADRAALTQDHRAPVVHGLVGLVFLSIGAFRLVSAAPLIAQGHWGSPAVVSAVHALTLGWLLTLIIGTLYQLGPVALRLRPRGPRLWRVLLPLHAVGTLIVTIATASGDWSEASHGWGLVAGVALASAIILLGPWRAPADTRYRARLVTLGFVSLGLTLALAASRLSWGWRGFMPDLAGLRLAHVALGLGGFGTLIAWAIGGHVLPMFLGTRAKQSLSARIIPWLLLGGALLTIPAVAPELAILRPAAAFLLAGGQFLMCWQAASWFKARANAALDPALALVAVAFVSLLLASVTQVVLVVIDMTGPGVVTQTLVARAISLWGVLALPGWLSLLIAGVLYRVFVFLSWMLRAGPGVARNAGATTPPPRVSQFARPALAWTSVACFASGLVLLSLSIVFANRSGAFAGALLYACGAIVTLLHHLLAFFAAPRAHSPGAVRVSPLITSS